MRVSKLKRTKARGCMGVEKPHARLAPSREKQKSQIYVLPSALVKPMNTQRFHAKETNNTAS